MASSLRFRAREAGSTISEFDQWPHSERPEGAKVFAHNERIIPAPPDQVWNLIVEAQAWSAFYANARFVALADPRQHYLKNGSVFRWVTFGMPIISEVHSYQRPLVIGWRWHCRWWKRVAHGYHIWLLEPHERGTRVVTEETNRGVLPSLLYPVVQPLLWRSHDYWLRQLERQVSGPLQPVEPSQPAEPRVTLRNP